MPFKAKFELDGKTFNVQNSSFSLHQNVDATGRPSSDVRGGIVSVSVESTEDNTLFEWMTDAHAFKDGKITFFKRDQDSKMKELEFKSAACIDYSEHFDAISNSPMLTTITFSAKEITLAGGTHTNPWPV